MQNIIIDKPYSFVPPHRGAFWPAVFHPFLRPYLSKVWGVTSVEVDGIERLRAVLKERASVVLAPNHCRGCDPTIVALLGAQAGAAIYIMASWHLFMGTRFQAWFLRRIGAFSVYREGLDRAAVKCAIELLVEDRRPLVIFPEGIITRGNDSLAVFNEGPAFIARSAAKQRTKAEPGCRTVIVPVALKYRFLGRLEESVCPVIDRIESRLTWKPRPELPLIQRLQKVGNAILGLQELEIVGEVRQGDIQGRLVRLSDDILAPLETEWKIKKPGADVPGRVRALRSAILPDLVEGGITDSERARRWEQLARLYLAQQLSLYPAGYLAGTPSVERVLETVERLEEDLTDAATVHRPITATVQVGEPIEVTPTDRDLGALMNGVRTSIQTMLGISTEAETAAAAAAPAREDR